MIRIFAVLLLSVIAASAQDVVLCVSSNRPWQHYRELSAVVDPRVRVLDVSDWRGDDVSDFIRDNSAFAPNSYPCLFDTATAVAVPVVGTNVAAALQSLEAAVSNATPPEVHAARAELAAILGTNTLAQMRANVAAQIDAAGNSADQKKAMQAFAKYILVRDSEQEAEKIREASQKKAKSK